MAIKGKYKKDTSLDSSTYKSPTMITSEFQGVTEGKIFEDDYDAVMDDTTNTLLTATGGLTGMNLVETALLGMAGEEAEDAYRQAMEDKAENKYTYKDQTYTGDYVPILQRSRVHDAALAEKSEFDQGVQGMMKAIGDNVVTYKLSGDGDFLTPSSWTLDSRYHNLPLGQRQYIKEGIADTLSNKGYKSGDLDTVYMGDDEKMAFSKSGISENYGRFGIRRKPDTFAGEKVSVDGIEPNNPNIMKEMSWMEKKQLGAQVAFERAKEGIGDAVEFGKESWETYKPTFEQLKSGEMLNKTLKLFEGRPKPSNETTPYGKTKPDQGFGEGTNSGVLPEEIIVPSFTIEGTSEQQRQEGYSNSSDNMVRNEEIIPEAFKKYFNEQVAAGKDATLVYEEIMNKVSTEEAYRKYREKNFNADGSAKL